MAMAVPITVLLALDLMDDYRSGVSVEHMIVEIAFWALGFVAAGLVLQAIGRARRREGALEERLLESIAEAEKLRAETRKYAGQGEGFERQFEDWQLSPAERDVAVLLLKGYSYQQIGASRNAAEGTVRQQALSVYRKAGLSGRSELAAYFLEVLLIPAERNNDLEGRSGARQ